MKTTPRYPALVWPVPYPGESDAIFAKRIARGYRDMPEAYHLYRLRWQIMGHLTFKRLRLPARIRRHMFTATMRNMCKSHRVYYPNLMWAIRPELGTRKDLCPHFHILIAAIPERINLRNFCTDCAAQWRAFGGGFSVVKPYTRQLNGAGYIAKRPDTDIGPAGDDCGLTLSDAALDYLRRVVHRETGI